MAKTLRQVWSGSLKVRLTISLVMPFLIAGVLIALAATRIVERDIREEIEREQQSRATLIAQSLENQFVERIGVLNTLATEASVRWSDDTHALDQWLQGQQAASLAFNRGVFITDARGIAVASWPQSAGRLGLDYSDRDYIRAALDVGRTTVGKPVVGRPLGKPVLLIGTPIRNSSQNTIGVVVGVTDLGKPSFLDSLFSLNGWSSASKQYHLIDPAARMVVASTDRSRVMEVLPTATNSPGWQAILASDAPNVPITDQGMPVLASARPVRSLGWMLVLTVPSQEALAWTEESKSQILLTTSALALTSLILALWFLKLQFKPLKQTTGALTRQLASGEPTSPLPVYVPDEIGSLIGAFNTLLKKLQEREESLLIKDSALRSISQGILITGADRKVIAMNPSFSNITGYVIGDMLGRDCKMLQGPQTDPQTIELIRHALAQGVTFAGEILNYRKNGEAFWNDLTITPVRDSAGSLVNFIGVTRDITERHMLEEHRRISATAFESQEGIFVTDAQQKILRVNKSFTAITGYTEEDVIGRTPKLLSSGRHDAAFYAQMHESLAEFGYWQGEIWNRRKSGELFPESITVTAVRNEDGVTSHYVANFIDIGARKNAETLIHQLAYFDPLTHLPNRHFLEQSLSRALLDSPKARRHGALLFLDLDNFKLLNDTRGHLLGDALLIQVAQRLRAAVRETDAVIRLGGDEFVILLEGLDGDSKLAEAEAETVGRKLLTVFQLPFELDSADFSCSASIGVTLFGDRIEGTDGPLRRADLAMYQAKSAGRSALRLFDESMQAQVSARVSMEEKLRNAVKRRELFIHLQPQLHASGQVIGAEALLRWNDPTSGPVRPDIFIPLAEQSGLILEIGRWVLNEACATLALWQQHPVLGRLTLSINVSARQLQSAEFVRETLEAVQHHGIDGTKLKLELTESMLLEQIDETIGKMSALRQEGIQFSLDDFGTGYSSLSYLKRLPVDEMKIDRTFVRDILVDTNDAAIARMVLSMAATLGMVVVAEGVEQEAQLDFLKGYGCQYFQGYLFSRPLPLDAFVDWVQSRSEVGQLQFSPFTNM